MSILSIEFFEVINNQTNVYYSVSKYYDDHSICTLFALKYYFIPVDTLYFWRMFIIMLTYVLQILR